MKYCIILMILITTGCATHTVEIFPIVYKFTDLPMERKIEVRFVNTFERTQES